MALLVTHWLANRAQSQHRLRPISFRAGQSQRLRVRRNLTINSAQPGASLHTEKHNPSGNNKTSKRSFDTSMPPKGKFCHLRIPSLLMRARAQATVRVKKRLEHQAHARCDIRGGCWLASW